MAYHTSRHSSRRNGRSRRRGQGSIFPWKALLGGAACLGFLAGGGYFVMQDLQTAKPDELGCYSQSRNRAYTTALVDVSEPGFDEVQSRDLIKAFTNMFSYDLSFNERFSMVTTAQSKIGSVSAPIVTFCAPAKSPADLERIEAATATQVFLDRQAEKVFEKRFKPRLDAVFNVNPADDDRQKKESPILEQIQSVSRMPGFSDSAASRRLIIVSDLLQSTSEAQFCYKQGHLPSFEKFKAKPYYRRIRPASLDSVDVKIYMLIRGSLGTPPFAYCTEDELTSFWHDYFVDAGARSVEIVRLRRGRG